MKLELSLLDENYIYKNKLGNILNCAITDFSRLTSLSTDENEYNSWWIKPHISGTCINYTKDGFTICNKINRYSSIRPIINYSTFENTLDLSNREVYFGEYPQDIVDPNSYLFSKLEGKYRSRRLEKTDKIYTINGNNGLSSDSSFTKKNLVEYMYNGNKYVRLLSNEVINNVIHTNINYIRVLPIEWYVDKENKLLISKKGLVSGIRYSLVRYTGEFLNSELYDYMNEYLIKDIIPSKYIKKEISNPYDFYLNEVSEMDIIRSCIESDIPIMLHGESGDGKSARIRGLDKDAVVVYMLTQGLDSFIGKSVLINNELVDIPPTWYMRLKHICESEPDKLHIVFFDELSNAPPTVQAMAFNIVLEHEINGKWKLPRNARIASAMNEMTESRSSYGLAEPLYNRFAHVYIKTNSYDWLEWAISDEKEFESLDYKEEIKRKIHPSIYAYISYKGEALRTKYTGISPNADPRKWEMASKMLYSKNNPNLISCLIGEEITADFINFCTSKVITIEDVLNNNYSNLDLSVSEKYNTVVALSKVDIEHFEIIREFTKKLGSEMVSLLDTLWATSIEKLEVLQEINLKNKR